MHAQRVEFSQRADMRPAARGACSEYDPDFRPSGPPTAPAGSVVYPAMRRGLNIANPPENDPTMCLPLRNLSLRARCRQTINVKLFLRREARARSAQAPEHQPFALCASMNVSRAVSPTVSTRR